MPTLREVKKRIKTVVSTKRITKAMEMVAAAKLRRAQQKVEQTRPYADKMDEMLSHLAAASSSEISHPYFDEREVKRQTVVVIASDRGLCGSYNANVIRRAIETMRSDKKEAGIESEVFCVGKKVNDILSRRDWPIVDFFGDWGGNLDYERAKELVARVTGRFVSGETDRVKLVYTRFLSMVKYRITVETYLPVPRLEMSEGEAQHMEYIFEPSPEEIYAALMPSYATTKMVTALAESFASEHGSRMMAMSNATSNAGEMIDTLTLQYNKARQGQITKELLEVVSGAEALRG